MILSDSVAQKERTFPPNRTMKKITHLASLVDWVFENIALLELLITRLGIFALFLYGAWVFFHAITRP